MYTFGIRKLVYSREDDSLQAGLQNLHSIRVGGIAGC